MTQRLSDYRIADLENFRSAYLFSEVGRSYVSRTPVLELGAGTGLISILCANYLNASSVLATDGSAEVVDELKSNLQLNGLGRAQYVIPHSDLHLFLTGPVAILYCHLMRNRRLYH